MTVEEKAKEYSNSEGIYNEHGERLLYMGYLAGYKDATRWRDPKQELPDIDESVIVKYRTAKNVEKYGIGKYFNLGIGNPWTIEGSTSRKIIVWRPIE
jgi:hypothetical protein